MSKIVILSGPGGRAFNNNNVQELAEAMRSSGADVTLLGDGEKPITKEQVTTAMEMVASDASEPVTLFVMAHGDVKSGNHVIDIDGKYGLTSAELFDTASRVFGDRTLDVFMTCCHGGAAIPEVNRLPKGSTLATLAPGKETVSGVDIDRLTDAIDSSDLTAHYLADLYLGRALKNRIAPSIAVSGQGVHDLPRKFIDRLGKPFSDDEKTSAHGALDKVIGEKRVSEIIAKIAGAKNEWSIDAVDFGPALAISLAASPGFQPLSSFDPNRGSHSGAGCSADQWGTRLLQLKAGTRSEPRPYKGDWTDFDMT